MCESAVIDGVRRCPPYEIATVAEIGATPTDDSYGFTIPGEWKQLRHHFGIREFSANAMVATEAGQTVVHEHFERANDDTTQPGDEELYVSLRPLPGCGS